MVNGLAVLGWGVGGIEAEAAMLGQPLSMLIPEVVGFELTAEPKEGVTATDIVLTVTQMLRKKGVVGKFVEFYGKGLDASLARRPRHHRQYGAGIWRDLRLLPVDGETLDYLKMSGRSDARIALVEAYAKAQGLFREADTPIPNSPTRSRSIFDRRPLARRTEAPRGPRRARGCRHRFRERARDRI